MIKYFDFHCHLSCDSIDDTIQKAHSKSVVGMVWNSANVSDWGDIIKATKRYKNLYGAIGVHPWCVNSLSLDWHIRLKGLLDKNPDLMVGEIGLDKYHPDIETQISVFITQLKIAHQLNRGVMIHCVGMWNKLKEILNAYRNELPPFIVAHGYCGSELDIERFSREYNMYFSYSLRGFLHGVRTIDRISKTPLNCILTESDTHAPTSVIDVADKISTLCNISPSVFYENATRILKK